MRPYSECTLYLMEGENQSRRPDATEGGDLVAEILLMVVRRKRIIVGVTLAFALLSVIYSLFLPNIYTATARVLPPESSTPSAARSVLQPDSVFGGLIGSFLSEGSPSELYVGILRSRTVADALLKRFDLRKRYGTESETATYETLRQRTDVEIADTGIIRISVDSKDPKLAADMANAYVEALARTSRSVGTTSGSRQRAFLEKRLDKVKQDLNAAEARLQTFQEKHGLVAIDAQARAAIEGAARLKGELIAAQTELAVLRQFATEKQNETVMLRSRIAELEKQLTRIETGDPEDDSSAYFIPFSRLPGLGMRLAGLLREAKTQEEVLKLLTVQHELAKMEEAKDISTVQVLDRAVVPDKKSGPARRVIVMLLTFAGGCVALLLAGLLEYAAWLRQQRPEQYSEMLGGLWPWPVFGRARQQRPHE